MNPPTPMPRGPRLLLSSRAIDVVELRTLLVINCHSSAYIEDVDVLLEGLPPFVQERSDGVSLLLTVGERAAARLDDELRTRCVALSRLLKPIVRAKAYVIEGGGFARSGLRTAISTINMLSRSACPCRIFDEVRPALDWLADLDPSIGQGELRSLTALMVG